MLMGRSQNLLAALCGAFLASLSACDDQQPLREMRIQQPFALGKYELTVGEFRHFVEAAAGVVGSH